MKIFFIVFSSLLIFHHSIAQPNDSETDFLLTFLEGNYRLIGQISDSACNCYCGEVRIVREGERLKVRRLIQNKTVEAAGKIDYATADSVRVLQIDFSESGENYRAVYLIHSDLGNYARLTGRVYRLSSEKKVTRLEALFAEHTE